MNARMDLGVTAVMLPELDFDEQIALCAGAGVRCYQFRPRLIPADVRSAPWSSWGNHRFDLTPDRLGCRRITSSFCGLEEGDLHIPSWIAALADAGIHSPLIIEDYAPGIPGADKLRKAARLLHAVLEGLDAEARRGAGGESR